MKDKPKEENPPMKTPLNELREEALKHYDELSAKCHTWKSDIPKAINFYYDALEGMSKGLEELDKEEDLDWNFTDEEDSSPPPEEVNMYQLCEKEGYLIGYEDGKEGRPNMYQDNRNFTD